jgi:hypothetical protein
MSPVIGSGQLSAAGHNANTWFFQHLWQALGKSTVIAWA